MSQDAIRTDWTTAEVADLYRTPLLVLVAQAAAVHARHHSYEEIQCCTLLSIKTGGCPEDCAYCPQAARYDTGVNVHRLMDVDEVMNAAHAARTAGSTRFCMGAAWREVRDNSDFDRVLAMVSGVKDLGLEVCCTLGMITEDQAQRLADAGLDAYNHNLDTSESFYGAVISTRGYDNRLQTLRNVRNAGISVCCGGIIGMGEGEMDRIHFLHTLATLAPHPESVPINALVPVEGTPLGDRSPVEPFELVRMIACARLLMPHAKVRLSAGRLALSQEAQALAFLAGANSIFTGEKLLTTPNPDGNADELLLKKLGAKPLPPHTHEFSITRPVAEPVMESVG